MSQQVYSSGAAYSKPIIAEDTSTNPEVLAYVPRNGPSRYLPRASETDYLTLVKNVNPGTPGEYGNAAKPLAQTGTGLFWDRLNGNACVTVASVVNYPRYQSNDTKPYWTISANAGVLGGATLLYSKCDNVIAVNAVIPGSFPGAAVLIPLKLAIIVMDSNNVRLHTYALVGSREVVGNQTDDPWAISAVVPVLAGQKIAIFGYSTGNSFRYQDELNGNPTITVECMLSFTKM